MLLKQQQLQFLYKPGILISDSQSGVLCSISASFKIFPKHFMPNLTNITINQLDKSFIKNFADCIKKLLHLLKRCSIFPSIQLCRYSSVVEHTLGKGGVASPILASGTISNISAFIADFLFLNNDLFSLIFEVLKDCYLNLIIGRWVMFCYD